MNATLSLDVEKGKKLAKALHDGFSTIGILGHTEMPEDILPEGVKRGSLEHIFFITLTVSIDYQRDANLLWDVSRRSFEDTETRYLFDPEALHKTAPSKIAQDMKKHRLSKKAQKDPHIWKTVGVSFYKKWEGDPRHFLQNCQWDSLEVLARLKKETHLHNGRTVPDYPFLRGNKIGPLWLRMLRDNVGISELKNLERVPIPVDIHIARSSLATGVVRGQFRGRLSDLFDHVRQAWFQSVEGLSVHERPMISLDVDEPLWHLSKYGCSSRKENGSCLVKDRCEAADFCVGGKISIRNNSVELDT